MSTALGTVLEGAACYHQYLAAHPEKAVNAPSWARLTSTAQLRWRQRAAEQEKETRETLMKRFESIIGGAK